MKYLVLVSHGKFASGLLDGLTMLTGKREDILSIGLENGMSMEVFIKDVEEMITSLHDIEEIFILADIIGGSPLTSTMQVLDEKGILDKTTIIGGMNLPLALTMTLMKDTLPKEELVITVLAEARTALQQFTMPVEEDEDI